MKGQKQRRQGWTTRSGEKRRGGGPSYLMKAAETAKRHGWHEEYGDDYERRENLKAAADAAENMLYGVRIEASSAAVCGYIRSYLVAEGSYHCLKAAL
jgi:hypothetical protein